MRALLDVNVLVALLDSGHVHHGAASTWLDRHIEAGWASCPITQTGCLRALSAEGHRAQMTFSAAVPALFLREEGPSSNRRCFAHSHAKKGVM